VLEMLASCFKVSESNAVHLCSLKPRVPHVINFRKSWKHILLMTTVTSL
jgi:hypothetical protein